MLAAVPFGGTWRECELDADEWVLLGATARQHRLEPLLHGLLPGMQDSRSVPASHRAAWQEAHRRSAMAALAAKAALIRVGRILDTAGIAYAALKGGWLAWHAYPNPALRPMRDLDILVSPSRLEAAYRALVARGFEELSGEAFSAATLAMGQKHLPALRDQATGIFVEVHSRLFEHIEPAQADARLARSDDLLAARLWQPLGPVQIAYLPPCETLLHVLVHSAYEHRFDNGPQVLHDVSALLAREAVDWERFWTMADEGGWTRGCQLVLRLTECMLGPQATGWGPEGAPTLPDGILDQAALMLLQDPDLRQDLDVQLQLGDVSAGGWVRLQRLAARMLPARRVVAAQAGVSPDRRSAWLHYPGWLVSRFARTARGALDGRQRSEVVRANAIETWLAGR